MPSVYNRDVCYVLEGFPSGPNFSFWSCKLPFSSRLDQSLISYSNFFPIFSGFSTDMISVLNQPYMIHLALIFFHLALIFFHLALIFFHLALIFFHLALIPQIALIFFHLALIFFHLALILRIALVVVTYKGRLPAGTFSFCWNFASLFGLLPDLTLCSRSYR